MKVLKIASHTISAKTTFFGHVHYFCFTELECKIGIVSR